MSKQKTLSVVVLILCIFPAYNIIKVLQNRPNTQSTVSTVSSDLPREAKTADTDPSLGDLLTNSDIEITFSDGTVEDAPVDQRPLNLRKDYPNSSDSPTRLSEIFIEDPAVVECLQNESPKNISDVVEFHCSNLGVRSLEGLQHFPNLTQIFVWLTPEAKPNFAALPNLKSIALKGKGHSTFDFSGNPKLTGIFLNEVRGLESLDLSKNTALESFQLKENKLTSLKLPRTKTLRKISVEDTPITSLDLSGYPNLESVDVSSNQLAQLKLPENSPLYEVFASENKLTTFTVPNGLYLESLRLNGNPITGIKGRSAKLERLYLSDTKLSNFDGTGFPALKVLALSDVPLKSIDTSGNYSLVYLDLDETSLSSLDVSSNSSLETLIIQRTPISAIDISNNWKITNLNYTAETLTEANIKTGDRHPKKWRR